MSDQTEPEAEKAPVSGSTVSAQNLRPWRKGFSGNPSGRRKEEGPVRDLARRYTVRAIRRLAQLMASNNERVAVIAAQALLDRGWGKPAQALTGPDGGPLGLVVGMLPTAPITTAEEAARVYMEIMRGPIGMDLSGITFDLPPPQPHAEEGPLPSVEAALQPIEAEPLYRDQSAAAPGLDLDVAPTEVPSNVTNIAEWERLGK
jgi:hypothetical protein